MTEGQILVTGGAGFLASHTIAKLLQQGYRVRATLRIMRHGEDLRDMLEKAGIEAGDRLSFVDVDLLENEGWAKAMAGCTYVLHIATPFPAVGVKDEDGLVRPAREAMLRVLRTARDAGVKRVVATSCFAAIGYGHAPREEPFDESDWTDIDAPGVTLYAKSKTLAERAAWEFIEREGKGLELTVINPAGMFGPLLGARYSSSVGVVKLLIERAMPALPRLWFGVADVRDVADLHIRAMTAPEAKGERFVAVSGDFLELRAIARIIKRGLGAMGKRVPTRAMPDWLVRLISPVDGNARSALPELGKRKNATSAKAQRLLKWQPRPAADALLATTESLQKLGLIGMTRRARWFVFRRET